MGWKGESRRHSLSRKGIKTSSGCKLKTPVVSKGQKLFQKQWVMYHGTGFDEAKNIEKEGLTQKRWQPIFLSPDKKVAMNYAIEGAKYGGAKPLNRKPAIFKVVLNEQDFEDMKEGREVDEDLNNIIELRKKNLDDLFNPDYPYSYHHNDITEYEWYYPISPDRLERVL